MKKIKKILLGALSTSAIIVGLGASIFCTSSSSNLFTNQIQTVERRSSSKRVNSGSGIYYETINEIEENIEKGLLPSFHNNYKEDGYYQLFYRKMNSNGITEIFKNYTEDQIGSYIEMYRKDYRDFSTLITNLKVPTYALKENQVLSVYFDGESLYLITTTKYIAKDTFNLQSVTINGITYNQKIIESEDPHLNGNGLFELTSYYLNAGPYDIQINATVIGQYHTCKDDGLTRYIGVPLMKEYNISGFTYNLDPIQNGIDPSKTDEELGTTYKVTSNDNKTFTFSELPSRGKSVMKISTHAVVTITDVECQSYYQLNNNAFNHYVWFNTNLPLDKIYRVDVSYDLSSDNKKFYEFTLKDGPINVSKSLTDEKVQGGFLNLSTYSGIEKGTYKSNQKTSKEYKYQLHLNYNSNGWAFFTNPCEEGSYTNVHNFKMLRLAYVVEGDEIEGDAIMDEIDGKTLNVFSRDAITNVDSSLWKFKEGAYETTDKVEEGINSITQNIKDHKNIFYIILGSIGGILLLYGLIKLLRLVSNFFHK